MDIDKVVCDLAAGETDPRPVYAALGYAIRPHSRWWYRTAVVPPGGGSPRSMSMITRSVDHALLLVAPGRAKEAIIAALALNGPFAHDDCISAVARRICVLVLQRREFRAAQN